MPMQGDITYRGVFCKDAYVVMDNVYRDGNNVVGTARIYATKDDYPGNSFGSIPVNGLYARGDWVDILEKEALDGGVFAGFKIVA